MLKLFKRHVEELHVRRLRATRAVYQGSDQKDHIEIEIDVHDGMGGSLGTVTLVMQPEWAQAVVREVGAAYEAINPPLIRRNIQAEWDGSSNF